MANAAGVALTVNVGVVVAHPARAARPEISGIRLSRGPFIRSCLPLGRSINGPRISLVLPRFVRTPRDKWARLSMRDAPNPRSRTVPVLHTIFGAITPICPARCLGTGKTG